MKQLKLRKAKLLANKNGSGSTTFRATLPTAWIRQMGLNEQETHLKLAFDGERIIIEKHELSAEKEIIRERTHALVQEVLDCLKARHSLEELIEAGLVVLPAGVESIPQEISQMWVDAPRELIAKNWGTVVRYLGWDLSQYSLAVQAYASILFEKGTIDDLLEVTNWGDNTLSFV